MPWALFGFAVFMALFAEAEAQRGPQLFKWIALVLVPLLTGAGLWALEHLR